MAKKVTGQAYDPQTLAYLQAQYAPQADASYSDRDLAELFNTRNTPVYSVGQGIAEAGSKIGEAYLRRKAREKALGEQKATDEALASAYINATGGGPTQQQTNPQGDLSGGMNRIDQTTPQQRAAAALAGIPAGMKMQALPMLMSAAQQANPQFSGTLNAGDVAYVNGRQVAAAPPKPLEPKTVSTAQGVFTLNPDGSLGTKLGDAAREPEPLVQIPNPTDPTKPMFVPRSQAIGREAFQPTRERAPRMQTYYGEDGTQLQLDSNDPEDQKTIKNQGLVSQSPSDTQRAAKGYLDRMTAAENIMMPLLQKGFDPANPMDTAKSVLSEGLTSKDYQSFLQAAKDWTRAKLRKESGAVIGKDEALDEVKTYFPSFNQDPDVSAQKTASRMMAQRQLATEAGILGRKRLRELDAAPTQQNGGSGGWSAQEVKP